MTESTRSVPPAPIDESQDIPEEEFLVWQAADRPYKKRDREYYTTIAIIVFLLSAILLFAGQFLPIAVVISIAFVSYVLAAIPPEQTTNAMTNYGIYTGTQFVGWDEMRRFWFTLKFKQPLLHIETTKFPGRMTLLLGKHTEDELRVILRKYMREEVPNPTFFDQAAEWLQEKFPLEKETEKEVPIAPPEKK